MKKRVISVILSAVMAVGLLAGCGSEGAKEENGGAAKEEKVNDTLTMAINSIPESLWSAGGSASRNAVSRPLFDILAFPTEKGFDYYLADKIEASDDYKTFKFHLREDATWSDGKPVTSQDIEFTLKYYIEVQKTSASKFGTFNIIDDKNFEFVMDETRIRFLSDLLPYFVPLPAHPFDGDVTKVDGTGYMKSSEMVTSGPYKVLEVKEDHTILEARDDYYGGKPEAKKIIQRVIPNTAAQQVAFDNGELSYFEATTAQILEKYSDESKYNIEVIKDTRLNYLHINSALSDEAREAITLALNGPEIVDIVYGSDKLAKAANSPLSLSQTAHNKECGYKQDIERAKELAESSGLTGKTLTYLYNADRVNMEEIGTVIQQQLANIGVNVKLEGVDTATFFPSYLAEMYGKEKTWDLCTNGVTFLSGDGMAEWFNYVTKANYGFGFKQEIIDKAVEADKTIPVENARQMIYDLQVDMLDNNIAFPISYTNIVMVAQKNVSGLDSVSAYSGVGDFSKIKIN